MALSDDMHAPVFIRNELSDAAAAIWDQLTDGNVRFASDHPANPRRTVNDRLKWLNTQAPVAAVFSCSDSRVSAEIVFDAGIGDLFVIRNAGLVPSTEAIGSVEFAVAQLAVPLIVLMTHDGCGAVQAALASSEAAPRSNQSPLDRLVQGLQPAVTAARLGGTVSPDEVRAHHREGTIQTLIRRSSIIRSAVEAGALTLLGANYSPSTGRVTADVLPRPGQ
ncbi:carbonic anhydrase [Frondihabitans peucedani]|jgi:carbonic anhydrase|uniref:carbonic anhydrase n=1 Tax=Frondihabitans peucedani TaxID=598626 RepID=A0ABP8E566_9MICO